jgi:hypothetical protein
VEKVDVSIREGRVERTRVAQVAEVKGAWRRVLRKILTSYLFSFIGCLAFLAVQSRFYHMIFKISYLQST